MSPPVWLPTIPLLKSQIRIADPSDTLPAYRQIRCYRLRSSIADAFFAIFVRACSLLPRSNRPLHHSKSAPTFTLSSTLYPAQSSRKDSTAALCELGTIDFRDSRTPPRRSRKMVCSAMFWPNKGAVQVEIPLMYDDDVSSVAIKCKDCKCDIGGRRI